jgi:hypothetical protein
MQEAGVGIYYSESFNSFADLGRSLRNRFVHRDSLGRELTRTEYRAMKAEQRDRRKIERENNKRQKAALDSVARATNNEE